MKTRKKKKEKQTSKKTKHKKTQPVSPSHPKVRYIFILNEEFEEAGDALASLEWMHSPQNQDVRTFSKGCFADMQAQDFQRMVFLGHANTQMYGKYSADNFVTTFAKQCELTGHDQSCVGELCLIGCELGLIRPNGTSLAQDIADKLKKEGFENAKVRTIASPAPLLNNPRPLPQGTGMIVQVTSNAGLPGGILGNRDGYISGYLLNSEARIELDEQLATLATSSNIQTIKQFEKENKAVCFFQNKNPAIEFAKAENLFIPDETPQARLERIQADPDFQRRQQQSADKKEALVIMQAQINHLNKKAEHLDTLEHLKSVIDTVKKADPAAWQTIIKNGLEQFRKMTFTEQFSTTYKILKNLAAGKLAEAREKLAASDEDLEVLRKQTLISSSNSLISIPQRIATGEGNSKPTQQKNQIRVAGGGPSSQENSKRTKRQQKNAMLRAKYGLKGQESRKEEDNDKFVNAIAEINDLISRLVAEIKQLNQGCFPWVHGFEITTKETKRNELIGLRNSASSWEQLVANATVMRDTADKRTFRGMKKNQNSQDKWVKNRTGALINRIINEPDTFNYEPKVRRDRAIVKN